MFHFNVAFCWIFYCIGTLVHPFYIHWGEFFRLEQPESEAAVHDNESASSFPFQSLPTLSEIKSWLVTMHNCSKILPIVLFNMGTIPGVKFQVQSAEKKTIN